MDDAAELMLEPVSSFASLLAPSLSSEPVASLPDFLEKVHSVPPTAAAAPAPHGLSLAAAGNLAAPAASADVSTSSVLCSGSDTHAAAGPCMPPPQLLTQLRSKSSKSPSPKEVILFILNICYRIQLIFTSNQQRVALSYKTTCRSRPAMMLQRLHGPENCSVLTKTSVF
jgi:hypothetical protein